MLTRDHIARAVSALEAGELPDEPARLTLAATVRRACAGLPWDAAAGMAGTLALRERDAALRRAGANLDADAGPWALAGKLAEALARFEAHRWPRIRAGGAPRDVLDAALADALRAGGRPPGPHGGPLEGLRRPAAPGWIAPATRERLDAALLAVARDQALAELVDLLDPDGTRTPWDLAGEILRRLARFEAAAWPRIRSGARPANGRLEGLLAAILSDPTTPRSQKRLRPLLPP